MKILFSFLALLVSTQAHAQLPAGAAFSFKGKDSLAQVRSGAVTGSVRLYDRTQAPYSYVVGKMLPLINNDTNEEHRSEEEQVATNAYGFVEFTQIGVSQLTALSPADQAEIHQFYTQDKIDLAKGVITKVTFKFKASK